VPVASLLLPLLATSCSILGAFSCLGGLGHYLKGSKGKEREQEWCLNQAIKTKAE